MRKLIKLFGAVALLYSAIFFTAWVTLFPYDKAKAEEADRIEELREMRAPFIEELSKK